MILRRALKTISLRRIRIVAMNQGRTMTMMMMTMTLAPIVISIGKTPAREKRAHSEVLPPSLTILIRRMPLKRRSSMITTRSSTSITHYRRFKKLALRQRVPSKTQIKSPLCQEMVKEHQERTVKRARTVRIWLMMMTQALMFHLIIR